MIRGLFTFEGGGAGKRRCKVLVFGECEGGDDDDNRKVVLRLVEVESDEPTGEGG